jgi:hypothetical protein
MDRWLRDEDGGATLDTLLAASLAMLTMRSIVEGRMSGLSILIWGALLAWAGMRWLGG